MDDWFQLAACRGADTAIFFLEIGVFPAAAKRICGTCPVVAECDEYAHKFGAQLVGVFAGKTRNDRTRTRLTTVSVAAEHGTYQRAKTCTAGGMAGLRCKKCRDAWAKYKQAHRWAQAGGA